MGFWGRGKWAGFETEAQAPAPKQLWGRRRFIKRKEISGKRD